MNSTIIFSTCSAAATGLRHNAPDGIALRQLSIFDSEAESFDFSHIQFVATIDPNKISIRTAIDHLLSACSASDDKQYFEINGRRFSIKDTNAIYSESEKISYL